MFSGALSGHMPPVNHNDFAKKREDVSNKTICRIFTAKTFQLDK